MPVNAELQLFRDKVEVANGPEDVFGLLTGAKRDRLRVAKGIYHRFARVAHEDSYTAPADKVVAHEAFTRLTALWTEAQRRIEDGSYGKRAKPRATIQGKHVRFEVYDALAAGDVADLFKATATLKTPMTVVVKMARVPALNDLIENEGNALRTLAKSRKYMPDLLERLRLKTGSSYTAANVLSHAEGYVPLTQVVANFPEGINPRHFVWLFKRLLFGLGMAHKHGIVHGAVLPPHVLVHPKTHGVMLVDWCYSVPTDGRISAISSAYRTWYPPEVLLKLKATTATDIYMAARCMLYVLGHDSVHDDTDVDTLQTTIPRSFKAFLRSCLIRTPARRPQEAWELQDELNELAKEVYGASRYVPLTVD